MSAETFSFSTFCSQIIKKKVKNLTKQYFYRIKTKFKKKIFLFSNRMPFHFFFIERTKEVSESVLVDGFIKTVTNANSETMAV